jgi:hypothetical protein
VTARDTNPNAATQNESERAHHGSKTERIISRKRQALKLHYCIRKAARAVISDSDDIHAETMGAELTSAAPKVALRRSCCTEHQIKLGGEFAGVRLFEWIKVHGHGLAFLALQVFPNAVLFISGMAFDV